MICQWCHRVMSGALHWWFGVCRLGLRKRVGEMQWAPHNLNEGPHQAGDVCLVLSVSFTTAACDSMVRSLRRSLDSLSTACKIWSFFSSGSLCHFLAKRHVLTTLLHFFSTSLPYKYLTSYSTRLPSFHVQARLGCDAETPSETVRFQDALMKNHSAMWLQSTSEEWQNCNLFWIILDLSITMLCFFGSRFAEQSRTVFTRPSTLEAVLAESAASTAPAVVVEAEQSNVTKAFSNFLKILKFFGTNIFIFRLGPVRVWLSTSQWKSQKAIEKSENIVSQQNSRTLIIDSNWLGRKRVGARRCQFSKKRVANFPTASPRVTGLGSLASSEVVAKWHPEVPGTRRTRRSLEALFHWRSRLWSKSKKQWNTNQTSFNWSFSKARWRHIKTSPHSRSKRMMGIQVNISKSSFRIPTW